MPRKRKRDWPQRVFKYRVYPDGDPAQEMWDIARAQQRLWNDLVALWYGARHEVAQMIAPEIIERAFLDAAEETGDLDGALEIQQEAQHVLWSYRERYVSDLDNFERKLLNHVLKRARDAAYTRDNAAARKAIWQRFDEWARALVKQSGLNWEQGPDVLDRFRVTASGGKRPHFHREIDRVSISHRFTGGGIDLARLIDRRGRRFGLISSADWQPVRLSHSPGNQHWRGRFQFGDATLDFALALHRPLPAGAIAKRATWLGVRTGLRWFWYLAITVEQPPAEWAKAPACPSAGMDVGWRLFADGTKHDYLRVAMVADSEGRTIEIRLPLNLRPERIAESRGFRTMSEWQVAADVRKDAIKKLLGELDFPADLQRLKLALPRMGRRGLQRIYDTFKQRGLYPEHTGTFLAPLTAYDGYYNRIATLGFRLRERRTWYYRNLARWLCQCYGRIAIEDMFLPKLHRRNGNDPAFDNAAQYRNYAAAGELRAALKAAAAKIGTEIIEAAAVDSTVTCWICGAKAEAGRPLELSCSNGHEWDQDKNAARNLLSQMDGTFGQMHGLQKAGSTEAWRKLEIPDTIRAVAVEVPA